MCKIKTGIKMRVTPEQSRKIQEICFENNIYWYSSGKVLSYLDKPFLFIDECISFMYEDEEMEFLEDDNKEVSAELFIRTNGTCIESKTPSEPQQKTLSEYLKENGAYEEFIENYVEHYLKHIDYYTGVDLTDTVINIYNISIGENSKHDINYWYNLYMEQPKNLVYDMNEIIFNEVDKRINGHSQPKSEPKTLSEYLKENDSYESFVENCVEYFSKFKNLYNVFKEGEIIEICDGFCWGDTKQGRDYWLKLNEQSPKNLIYDMNEIVFAEVDKRIAEQESQPESDPKFTSENLAENSIVYDMDEIVSAKFITTEEFDQMLQQKTSKRYMVFVEGKSRPKKIHDSYDSAEKEAKRLSTKEIGLNVFVVEIVKEYKSKVVIDEFN